MIITCEQCRTRFKIPDEKVTVKGVKVRCTKCQHTFRVAKPAEPVEADPFALFGPADKGVGAGAPDPFAIPDGSGSLGDPASSVFDAPAGPTGGALFEIGGGGQSAVDPTAGMFDIPTGGGTDFDTGSAAMAIDIPNGSGPAPDLFDLPSGAPSASAESAGFEDFSSEPAAPEDWPGVDAPQPVSPAPSRPAKPAPVSSKPAASPPPNLFDEPDHSMFAMPPSAPAPGPAPAARADPGLLSDIPDLAPPPAAAPRAGARLRADEPRPSTVVTAPAPSSVGPTPPTPLTWGARLVRTVVGAVCFALVGGAAVVVLNGGTLPRLGARPAQNGPGGAAQVLTSLYETQNGAPVLFVRGEAQNRGSRPEKLRVKVELREGDQPLKSGSVLAGSVATPEELYRISSTADAEALRARLDSKAQAIAPGASAPFLLPFYEISRDVNGLVVKVSVEPERVEAARAVP